MENYPRYPIPMDVNSEMNNVPEVRPDPTKIWCVFDMDETLGSFPNLFGLTAFLSPSIFTEDIYRAVINSIALTIKNGFDIGVLRPGLHMFFSVLQKLKEMNVLQGAAVYSNNGWQYTVQFLVDIINAWYPGLFCEGISKQGRYPNKPDPEFRRINIVFDEHGRIDYKKQWTTIRNIFGREICGSKEPIPEQTFFYDDLLHDERKYDSDLKRILGSNYIQNSPYINVLNPEFWPILQSIFKHYGIIDDKNVFHPTIQLNIRSFPKFEQAERNILIRPGFDLTFDMFKYGIYDIHLQGEGQLPNYVPKNVGDVYTNIIREYEQHWVTPLFNKLTDEEKEELKKIQRGGYRLTIKNKRRQSRRNMRKSKKKARVSKKSYKLRNTKRR